MRRFYFILSSFSYVFIAAVFVIFSKIEKEQYPRSLGDVVALVSLETHGLIFGVGAKLKTPATTAS